MSRLILIDPSLVSTVGHHHEFAHNVLSAAKSLGLSGVLAGHQNCTVTECGGWPVRRSYRDGLWTHNAGSAGLRFLSYATSLARRAGSAGEPVCAALQNCRDSWRARRFANDTAQLLREIEAGPEDLVFVPNATATEVQGVRHLLERSESARKPSWHLEFHFNVFPRAAPHRAEIWRSTRDLQSGLRRLREAAPATRLYLYTDTDELTRQYESLQAGAFFTLPIPVDPVFRVDESLSEPVPGPLKIAYVGDARGEKGYPQLPEMIDRVWESLVVPGIVRFVLQSNCRASRSEQPSLEARDRLSKFDRRHVELLVQPLATEAYRSLVLDSDVILLPYDPEAYEARSSGILSEALAAGKPVVVPEGTWMAEQLREPINRYRSELRSLGIGRDDMNPAVAAVSPSDLPCEFPRSTVGVIYPSGPEGMAAAVREVAAHVEHYRATARARSLLWTRRHDPRSLVNLLTEHASIGTSRFVLRQRIGSGN